MIDWKAKLTSRKFWAALCALVTNLILAFNGNQETAVQVTAIIMATGAVIAYIIGEGMVDAANAGSDTPLVINAGELPGFEDDEEEQDGEDL